MDEVTFDPTDFAAAYIQTLDFKLNRDDFESTQDYLDERVERYFNEYLRAQLRATDFMVEYREKVEENDD